MFKKTIGLLLMMGSPALALTQTPSPTFTPTPTPTPCITFGPPSLSVGLTVQPAHPVVGDQVVLSFGASGSGGLPTYSLVGGSPVLAGNPPSVHDNIFRGAQFALTAAQAGTAMVRLSVNFETSSGCVENPFFQFVTLTSDPFAVEVAPMPTATPTPPQGPARDEGEGCSVVPPQRAGHATLLLALPVAWILRRRQGRSPRA